MRHRMHSEILTSQYDSFHNPGDKSHDLGRDGAFTDFKIIVGLFCPQNMNETKFR
jgi:hypothetical protein